MEKLILFSVILSIVVATIAEMYKKTIRPNFKSWEIWAITIVLSLICGFFLTMSTVNTIETGIVGLFAYAFIVFAFQYLVDMELVKTVFKKLIEKVGK